MWHGLPVPYGTTVPHEKSAKTAKFLLLPRSSPFNLFPFSLYNHNQPSLSLTITPSNPPLKPSNSLKFFQISSIPSLHSTFLSKFLTTSPKYTLPHNPLSLSKTLTSIVKVEGYRERNCPSSCHFQLLPPLLGPDLLSIHTMGKKRVGEVSRAPSQPKKSSRAPSSSAATTSAKDTKDAYPLILFAALGVCTLSMMNKSHDMSFWPLGTLVSKNIFMLTR